MRGRPFIAILAVLGFAVFPFFAEGRENESFGINSWRAVPLFLRESLKPGATRESLVAEAEKYFDENIADDNASSKSQGITERQIRQRGEGRGDTLVWLPYTAIPFDLLDTAHQGAVTEADLLRSPFYAALKRQEGNPMQPANAAKMTIANIMFVNDANGDGSITKSELIQSDPDMVKALSIMTADADRNGKLTKEEVVSASETAFRGMDKNHDGVIQKEEISGSDFDVSKQENDFPDCYLRPAGKNENIEFIAGRSTKGVSPVNLISKNFQTGVVKINIEKGDVPLYLVVATSKTNTIWAVEGDVSRVNYIEVLAPFQKTRFYSGAVIGLPREKIGIHPNWSCLPGRFVTPDRNMNLENPEAIPASQFKDYLHGELGASPDQFLVQDILLSYDIGADGRIAATETRNNNYPEDLDGNILEEVRNKSVALSDYVSDIAQKKIISSANIEKADPPSGWPGIARFVHDGLIEPVHSDKAPTFRVLKPLDDLPRGLEGVKFISASPAFIEKVPALSGICVQLEGEQGPISTHLSDTLKYYQQSGCQ